MIPIIGLAIAAAVLFAIGGIGLVFFILRSLSEGVTEKGASILPIFELLEFVHQFLIGTVLYITAMGLYQLFIQDVPLPMWMKTESSEDLENNLIGVTVVVLAIEFLGAVFSGTHGNLLEYGAGIALPIAALALFLGLKHRNKGAHGTPAKIEVDTQVQ
ncbi:MAG: YqhA family protein [Anaerolineales bacterium]|nr:YqhA family protein [Anaerolineales bacterium]